MLKRHTTSWIFRTIPVAAMAVAFLWPLSGPLSAQNAAATLVSMTGQVSILQDGNNPSSAKALFIGSPISAKQTVVTGPGSYAKFHLEDGSTFEVFENSKAIFHNDSGWAYLLHVIIGHIQVFIDHSKGPNNNSVTTPTAVISVRGTVFDIVVEDDDGTTLVSVVDGLVHVRNTTAPGFEPLLHAGEWVRVFRGQGLIGKQINQGGILQKVLRAASDALRVYAQQHPGGISVGGSGGGVGGPVSTGAPGAQGDKGKGGAAPPPAPPSTTGH